MRLSRDDEGIAESSSITTQKKMLITFAKENGYKVYDEYIDDGWTGTNFDRPGFKRMINDIENGKVNMVITKDLSRLGRDYITTGQYTEIYFPEHNVRYIAINDGYDSNNDYNDIAPFKNVINELYARDTSKKIRSAFIAKMKEGNYIANFAPYGYKKDEYNKNKLVIDSYASVIVKDIFSMASNGFRPIDISKKLNEENIMSPAVYKCYLHPNLNINNYSKYKEWTSATVSKILKNIVYLGHTAQGKTNKISLKSKVTIQKPREDWIIVNNTHQPIIDQDTFDIAMQYRVTRTNKRKSDFKNIFSGIAKCTDCGCNMSTTGTRKKGVIANLVCGRYKLYGSKRCSNHFIDYETLYDIIMEELKKQISLSDKERNDIVNLISTEYDNRINTNSNLINSKDIIKFTERNKELDTIIKKLYEDNVSGKISDERFSKLMNDYEKEQNQIVSIIEKSTSLQSNVDKQKNAFINFFNLLNEIIEINELTSDILYKLIDKIEIGQGEYLKTPNSKVKQQTIKIYYRFIGSLDETTYSNK